MPPVGQPLEALSESRLAEAWASRAYAPTALVDEDGRVYRVVYPGRRWGGHGPDFRGALLALADWTLLRGDVEVHRRSSGWRQHGHAADPAYARVALHVVQHRDEPTRAADGRLIPTVELRLAASQPLPFPGPPCVHAPEVALRAVEDAGLRRFRARAARFEGDVEAVGAEQALWRGLAEAMGYSANTRAFGALAERLPWAEVQWLARRGGAAEVTQALVAASGLGADGGSATLSPTAWRLDGLRPANNPLRRCVGLGVLAERWCAAGSGGVVPVALAAVEAAAVERRPSLWRWACAPPWIGRGRALVAAVNVLLPFAAASGLAQAEALYRRLPGEPATRPSLHMARQLFGVDRPRFSTACQQQGLLQLFREACEWRVCEQCPAARAALPGAG